MMAVIGGGQPEVMAVVRPSGAAVWGGLGVGGTDGAGRAREVGEVWADVVGDVGSRNTQRRAPLANSRVRRTR